VEEFRIGQLTKELVAIKLQKMSDPCAAAAELVQKTLSLALKGLSPNDPGLDRLIADACRGGITGLLLADQNLAKGAVLILEVVAELASEFNLDPAQAMKGALHGLADLHRFVQPEQIYDITHRIEANFMGAGEAFSQILGEIKQTQSGSREESNL